MLLLCVDPGLEKCGVAIVDETGRARSMGIVPVGGLVGGIALLLEGRIPDIILVGDGTSSAEVVRRLGQTFSGVSLETVREEGSTLEAGSLWAEECKGLIRLLPLPLRRFFAPAALDHYAALVLARRWLSRRKTGTC